MATNADKAARFAAVITPALRDANPRNHDDAASFLAALPRRLHLLSRSGHNVQSALPTPSFMRAIASECNDVFLPISDGYSYDERVARIVWNTHTSTPELWLTTHRFSDTTARHKQLYRAAYASACQEHGFTPTAYITAAAKSIGITRSAQVIVDRDDTISAVDTHIRRAAAPGRHATTRYAELDHALRTLQYQIRLITEAVPTGEYMYEHRQALRPAHEKTVWDLADKATMVDTLRNQDVRTMRAMIAGMLALEAD